LYGGLFRKQLAAHEINFRESGERDSARVQKLCQESNGFNFNGRAQNQVARGVNAFRPTFSMQQ